MITAAVVLVFVIVVGGVASVLIGAMIQGRRLHRIIKHNQPGRR